MPATKPQAFDLDAAERKLVGTLCPQCGSRYQRVKMMDLRHPRPRKNSYVLFCRCLHPGDTILGSAIF
jgi:uncharacterized OB-fold protein